MASDSDQQTKIIVDFLSDIGLKVAERKISLDTFLPGICVHDGSLLYDDETLAHPGDLLHEAGHLAVISPTERESWTGDFTNAGGFELGAIAWSYAACLETGLETDIVFHKDGYKGEADWLLEALQDGASIGIPILQWKGMTNTCDDYLYPRMQYWLSRL